MTDAAWFRTTEQSLHDACIKGAKWEYDDGLTAFAVMQNASDGYVSLVISSTSRLDSINGYITYHNPILIPKAEIPYLIRALQEMVQ